MWCSDVEDVSLQRSTNETSFKNSEADDLEFLENI